MHALRITMVLLFFLLFLHSAQRKHIRLVLMKQGQVLSVKNGA